MLPYRPAASATTRTTRSTLVIAVLALCGTTVSLQQTLVLPLLPDFPRLLGTTADNATWLVTATLLTGAVSIPTLSRLADMYGKKRMMLVALAVTVLGSLVGALSESLAFVLTARAMQGVGMALVPIGIAIMRDELPRERVPLGVALMSATLAIGAGCGLPLSGLISEHMDWHSIFWVTGVAGAVMYLAVATVLTESPVQTRGTFDYRGALLLSFALGALLLALSKGGQWGWSSAATLGCVAAGLLVLVLWVPLELHTRGPLVDLRVASRPAVLLVNVASALCGFAMFANMLVTTQLLQLPVSTGFGLGLDVLHTGLWMAPSALVFGAMAPASTVITRRFGPQTTLLLGALGMAASYAARVFFSHELWQIVAGSMLVGAGTSMTFAAMPTLIMRAVPVTETASANGLNTLLRSVGTSSSSAAMGAVTVMGAVRVGNEVFPDFDSLVVMFWVAAAMSFVAGLVTVPMFRMREYAEEPEARNSPRGTVTRGLVVSSSGRPVRNAVVTVLTPAGDQVDWSQVDSAGDFSVATGGPGRYLLVTAAEGWTPHSRLVDLDHDTDLEPIVLPERLTLAGTVRTPHDVVPDALVALTRQSGEAVRSVRTAVDGRYEMPLPPNGRYVLTAMSDGSTTSRAVTVWGAERVVDLVVPEERPDPAGTVSPGAAAR